MENVSVSHIEGFMQVNCSGELVRSTASQLKTMLLSDSSHSNKVMLSLKDVSAIDLIAIQICAAWKIALTASGGSMDLIMPDSEAIRDILIKTGTVKLLQCKRES